VFISKFSLPLAYRLQNPTAKEKQGPVPEEISQTLLTNKKKGKTTKYTQVTQLTLLSQHSFAFTEYVYFKVI
jgi:hypothetical protein